MNRRWQARAVLGRDLAHVRLRMMDALRHPTESVVLRHPLRSMSRALALSRASIEAVRDSRRLKRDLPALQDLDTAIDRATSELEATYLEYVSTVSNLEWAVSLELAAVLLACCRLLRPVRMLDTGSGYSSYVLRRYAAETGQETLVISVDDDPTWLDKTREYLTSLGVSSDNTLTWDEFFAQGHGEFDVILHDLDFMEGRSRTLAHVLDSARPGGVVLLDDVNWPTYGPFARSLLKEKRFDSYNLKLYTRQLEVPRYAMLARRS